ncbi:MAG TPA: pseudouridine synthase [Edaphocola sp.]|nr:pseudouridine synthase [Edaphocola sp.]
MQQKTGNNGKSAMRLAKTMAYRGLCSRREADDYILKGWVKVNGEIVRQKGFPVTEKDEIVLSRQAVTAQDNRVTILLNKPAGYVSAQPEKGYKAAVSLITENNHWAGDHSKRTFQKQHLFGLAPAGRLDIDSKGLLILTNDGRIARQLISEHGHTEKEYLVRVTGKIKENGLALLNHGLSLDGQELLPAKVSWQNEHQLRFVLRQGKKRQIRRMCALVELKVVGLKRIRMGKVLLAGLPEGQWRYLGENEKF